MSKKTVSVVCLLWGVPLTAFAETSTLGVDVWTVVTIGTIVFLVTSMLHPFIRAVVSAITTAIGMLSFRMEFILLASFLAFIIGFYIADWLYHAVRSGGGDSGGSSSDVDTGGWFGFGGDSGAESGG